ncbi:MAG: hypothetical protein JSU96_08310 [Acidobacteriota bacterium]|nr:MAG: hypothetical protein JSU96_08310 [Acidobacteriota bacterium]
MKTSRISPGRHRREAVRYPIERNVAFKLDRRQRRPDPVLGKTMRVSSSDALFSGGHAAARGRNSDISISWPVHLNGIRGLRLVARGRVVRRDTRSAVIEIEEYEFRTLGDKDLEVPG